MPAGGAHKAQLLESYVIWVKSGTSHRPMDDLSVRCQKGVGYLNRPPWETHPPYVRGEDPFRIHRGSGPFRIQRGDACFRIERGCGSFQIECGDVRFRIHHQDVIRIFQGRYSNLVRIGSRFHDAVGDEPECIRPPNPRAMTGGERFIS